MMNEQSDEHYKQTLITAWRASVYYFLHLMSGRQLPPLGKRENIIENVNQ